MKFKIIFFTFLLCFTAVFPLEASKSCTGLIGKTVVVRGFGFDVIYVGATIDDIKEVVDSLIAKDVEGVAELVLRGRAFSIPVGTKVRILKCDNYRGMVKIRILDDKDYTGMSGWAYTDMVLGTE